ncbi:hypothetical protein BASA61_002701, partial [Batrachochytrium salamandrivorans]
SGNSSRSAAVTPLYNVRWHSTVRPTSIMRVMQGHYGSWQPTPQVTRWTCNTGMIVSYQASQIHRPSETVTFSTRISRESDCCSPFADESTESTCDDGVPPTPFARALLRVCGQVFASATIPRAWLCASIVSIDKKDGDPLNPGDKRGIALINVGLKLVCKVLQMRIERFVETNNLLSYEQAGFRKREECVGQVVSLVDIIQRRQNAGLNTHVLFIDIRKAFDTVPVGALLWKLQNMGFPRRTLAFLKALYTSSSARARAGSLLSDPFPSTESPWTTARHNPIRGLMYADDVAVFADSEHHCWLRRLLSSNGPIGGEMQFGVAKCGIISFTGHLAPRLDTHWIFDSMDSCGHGQSLLWAELVGGNKSHLHHCRQQSTRVSDCSLVPDSRLPLDPFWLKLGLGHFSLAHGITGTLVGAIRDQKTPITAICSGTDNDVFTLNVQGQWITVTDHSQERGCPEGDVHCPGLLFNLFINDISMCRTPSHPGLSRHTNPIRELM